MTISEKRQQAKDLREKYLTIARCQTLKNDVGCTLKVPDHPSIQVMQDGGAFVEAIIWIPKEAIDG